MSRARAARQLARLARLAAVAGLGLAGPITATAQGPGSPGTADTSEGRTAAPGGPGAAADASVEAAAGGTVQRSWDAAVGGVLVYAPEYAGAGRNRLRLDPGFYVRVGRVSLATRSGFRTAGDPGERAGLRIDLSPSDRLRFAVGLRYDAGRSDDTEGLRGMGDVPSTVRARFMASYRLEGGWSLGGATVLDMLGRGGGWQGDVGVGHQGRLGAGTTWGSGVALAFAGDRNLQTYFGVTEEQAARTGYPVYEPRTGLRDITAHVNARTPLVDHWHVFYGASLSRLLGPAAASPLTRRTSTWGLNAGLAYRF
jgi:outer membrane scaffolding protein for murein synthesis (MipA/OmpV family)